jgi:hypothetical protein
MTTTQLILSLIGWLVIQTVIIFVIWNSVGKGFDKNHPFEIGENGRRTIAFGVPFIVFAICLSKGGILIDFLDHGVGSKLFPYALGGTIIAFFAASMLMDFVPKRLSIILGTVGYVIGFSILYWCFVFTDPLEHFFGKQQ